MKSPRPLQTRDGTSSLPHVRSTKSGQTSRRRGSAVERALRVPPVSLDPRACVEGRADAVRAPASPVARDRAVDGLADDGGLAAPHLPCDLDGRPSQLEEEVDAPPLAYCHLLCHVGIPFLVFAALPRPHSRTPGGRHRIGYRTIRLCESKRTLLPRGRSGDLSPFTITILERPHPTPHCRSKQTRSGAFTSANHTTASAEGDARRRGREDGENAIMSVMRFGWAPSDMKDFGRLRLEV